MRKTTFVGGAQMRKTTNVGGAQMRKTTFVVGAQMRKTTNVGGAQIMRKTALVVLQICRSANLQICKSPPRLVSAEMYLVKNNASKLTIQVMLSRVRPAAADVLGDLIPVSFHVTEALSSFHQSPDGDDDPDRPGRFVGLTPYESWLDKGDVFAQKPRLCFSWELKYGLGVERQNCVVELVQELARPGGTQQNSTPQIVRLSIGGRKVLNDCILSSTVWKGVEFCLGSKGKRESFRLLFRCDVQSTGGDDRSGTSTRGVGAMSARKSVVGAGSKFLSVPGVLGGSFLGRGRGSSAPSFAESAFGHQRVGETHSLGTSFVSPKKKSFLSSFGGSLLKRKRPSTFQFGDSASRAVSPQLKKSVHFDADDSVRFYAHVDATDSGAFEAASANSSAWDDSAAYEEPPQRQPLGRTPTLTENVFTVTRSPQPVLPLRARRAAKGKKPKPPTTQSGPSYGPYGTPLSGTSMTMEWDALRRAPASRPSSRPSSNDYLPIRGPSTNNIMPPLRGPSINIIDCDDDAVAGRYPTYAVTK